GHGVGRLVAADALGHLVLQVELPLLQRLFFQLFLGRDLALAGQLVQSLLTSMVLIGPGAKLGVGVGKNLLNVSGTIRHRRSSFEVPIRKGILALWMGTQAGFG